MADNNFASYVALALAVGGLGLLFVREGSSSSKKKSTTGGTYKRRNTQNKSRRK